MRLALAVLAAAASVSIDEVRNIAFDKGIVKITEVELDAASGRWMVWTQAAMRSR